MRLEFLEALRRARAAAGQAVSRGVGWAPLLAAALCGAVPARAASSARLNILVDIQGIAGVIDLTAVPGGSAGTIALSWTEPYHPGGAPPFSYDLRVSSVAQIPDDAAFLAAAPLSAFSPSVPPAPGAGGGAAGFVVTGLAQGVTYYFAIRENDGGVKHGAWARIPAKGWNVNNFAASIEPAAPAEGAIIAVYESSVTASWAASLNTTDYVLIASTSPAYAPVAASSTTLSSAAALSGLSPNTTYFLAVSACGSGCSTFASIGSTITLAAPAVSLSATALSSSTVSVEWGANGNPLGTSYLVEIGTDGLSFSAAGVSTAPAASLSGLAGGVTYYFRVVAANAAGVQAAPSNVLSVLTPTGPAPSAPTGLAAAAGVLAVSLRWDALPPPLQGSGLLFYRVSRSTYAAFGFVSLATTTAVSYVDKPLRAGVTYYYRLSARDSASAEGPFSASAGAAAYTLLPMEPIGVKVQASSATITLSWSPTTRFIDGAAFPSTGAATSDELAGYSVYRSTDICAPHFVKVASLPATATALTDDTGGLNYFYRLFSYNSLGLSSSAVTLSTLGERSYFLDDCASRVVLDDKTAASLNADANGVGDIRIAGARRPQDLGNGVFQSFEWRALLNGASQIKNFVLPKPARVVLHFDVQNGKPVPGAARVAGGPSVNDLGAYWYNGAEFKKMYGRVDPAAQTVTVESPNLGVYQIRALARAAGAVFDLSNLSSRVITPNGDGLNDVAIFTYDPGPRNITAAGRIFDLQGAAVADMVPGLVPNTLTWDGRMNGAAAAGGVYVYRITGDGKAFTGTVVVAR